MGTSWCFNSAFSKLALKFISHDSEPGPRKGSWKRESLLQKSCSLSSEDTAPFAPQWFMCTVEMSVRVWNKSSCRRKPRSAGHMAHSALKMNGNTTLCWVLRPGTIRVLERGLPLRFEVSLTTKVWGNLEWMGIPKIRFGRQNAYYKEVPRHI